MSDWPSGTFLRSEALREYGPQRIRSWLDSGAWLRLDRGLYASVDQELPPAERIHAVVASVGLELAVVRESAAIVHGFGITGTDVVHLAGEPHKTARERPGVRVHGFEIPARDLQAKDGLLVTTPARTVVDIARSGHRMDGLAVADAAVRSGLCSTDQLIEQASTQRRARGIVQARRIAAWADGRSESPMESRTRLQVLEGGLPAPELQWWVYDRDGRPIYRLDFAWPDKRVGLEYDGADHLDRLAHRRDLERRAWLEQQGWRILAVAADDVYRRPAQMISRLNALLR